MEVATFEETQVEKVTRAKGKQKFYEDEEEDESRE